MKITIDVDSKDIKKLLKLLGESDIEILDFKGEDKTDYVPINVPVNPVYPSQPQYPQYPFWYGPSPTPPYDPSYPYRITCEVI